MSTITPPGRAAVEPGIYRHFKGGIYEVLCIAIHSETREEYVVYKNTKKEITWIRPLAMFIEVVKRDGYQGPRFTKVVTV